MSDVILPGSADATVREPGEGLELGLLLRAEEIDTVGKSIAWLVQEMLLNGFDAISHADLGARVEAILQAMPSARPIVLAMQFAIMDEDFGLAFRHASLLVARETALMELALAHQRASATRP
ncbi:MAG: hypothetical protein LCH88_06355 [Proteobacteria bacterium]|nr:hypothetical protein [Pseudomonadota bacterium]